MAIERTLSIIKPEAVAAGLSGKVLAQLEAAGLCIIEARMLRLDPVAAGTFYSVHKDRPFFSELIKYMSSGPIMVTVLEGENAILKNREVMGSTDPVSAAPGTIRAAYGKSISKNVVHGSDGPETAATEIAYFFPASDQRACL